MSAVQPYTMSTVYHVTTCKLRFNHPNCTGNIMH